MLGQLKPSEVGKRPSSKKILTPLVVSAASYSWQAVSVLRHESRTYPNAATDIEPKKQSSPRKFLHLSTLFLAWLQRHVLSSADGSHAAAECRAVLHHAGLATLPGHDPYLLLRGSLPNLGGPPRHCACWRCLVGWMLAWLVACLGGWLGWVELALVGCWQFSWPWHPLMVCTATSSTQSLAEIQAHLLPQSAFLERQYLTGTARSPRFPVRSPSGRSTSIRTSLKQVTSAKTVGPPFHCCPCTHKGACVRLVSEGNLVYACFKATKNKEHPSFASNSGRTNS